MASGFVLLGQRKDFPRPIVQQGFLIVVEFRIVVMSVWSWRVDFGNLLAVALAQDVFEHVQRAVRINYNVLIVDEK
jgi:hypothetical protein